MERMSGDNDYRGIHVRGGGNKENEETKREVAGSSERWFGSSRPEHEGRCEACQAQSELE